MIKFSENLLNLILLISLIYKCSNDTLEDIADLNEKNGEFTFEDTTIDDLETQTETDELFKETLGQASTSSIKITTQERSREEKNASTDDSITNPFTDLLTTKLQSKTEETNKVITQVTEHNSSIETESTVEGRSSPFSFSNAKRETSYSVSFTTQAVGTSSLSIQSSLLNSETTSLSITSKAEETAELTFNTRIQMNGIVRNRRIRTVKRVLIQVDRILFIEDVNVTNIEQALLKSIGYESIFNITNEGNDEYSIGFTTNINTSINSALSLDDSILKIVQNLKRDENIIQAEARKSGFDLSIDTSKAVIYATETLVINGTTFIIICEKSLDQVQMGCQKGTVENGTISIESNSEVNLESTSEVVLESTSEVVLESTSEDVLESTSQIDLSSLANSFRISKFLLFVVTIIFFSK
ncbi:hypothetical protein BpHYR1_037212 [Brachionus plicatilis]|uniref:Uncharacterized protein n=1 Tax=Brachionus plicatilis TaxID=10195 RepID=A0A3M7PLL0_BRAPC|nr:hypothetical protein BpHYR1_037212 [Brachionus plicatilis]